MNKPYMVVNMFCALTGAAHAQQRGYALNLFEVSERGSEWFSADSLDFARTPATGRGDRR